MRVVTVLGGYGVFGRRIATALVQLPEAQVRVAGRNARAGERFAREIGAEFHYCDLHEAESLRSAVEGAQVVVHAAGPFQARDYRVAEACLAHGVHYLDLADARAYVAGIVALNEQARARGLFLCSGASTLPAITSAMVAEVVPEFATIEGIEGALSPGNRNPRGQATVAGILSYLGRPVRVWEEGQWVIRTGWGDPRQVVFPPPIGRRRVFTCDVPDLDLFPEAWRAQTVRFSAGLELGLLSSALSALTWLVKHQALHDPRRYARLLRGLSLPFAPFGSEHGALAVWVRGAGTAGEALSRSLALVTEHEGSAVPATPAILLARTLLTEGPPRVGAFPCMGLLTLPEIIAHLQPLGMRCVRGRDEQWEE